MCECVSLSVSMYIFKHLFKHLVHESVAFLCVMSLNMCRLMCLLHVCSACGQ